MIYSCLEIDPYLSLAKWRVSEGELSNTISPPLLLKIPILIFESSQDVLSILRSFATI
jgi:hypothetical protein